MADNATPKTDVWYKIGQNGEVRVINIEARIPSVGHLINAVKEEESDFRDVSRTRIAVHHWKANKTADAEVYNLEGDDDLQEGHYYIIELPLGGEAKMFADLANSFNMFPHIVDFEPKVAMAGEASRVMKPAGEAGGGVALVAFSHLKEIRSPYKVEFLGEYEPAPAFPREDKKFTKYKKEYVDDRTAPLECVISSAFDRVFHGWRKKEKKHKKLQLGKEAFLLLPSMRTQGRVDFTVHYAPKGVGNDYARIVGVVELKAGEYKEGQFVSEVSAGAAMSHYPQVAGLSIHANEAHLALCTKGAQGEGTVRVAPCSGGAIGQFLAWCLHIGEEYNDDAEDRIKKTQPKRPPRSVYSKSRVDDMGGDGPPPGNGGGPGRDDNSQPKKRKRKRKQSGRHDASAPTLTASRLAVHTAGLGPHVDPKDAAFVVSMNEHAWRRATVQSWVACQ